MPSGPGAFDVGRRRHEPARLVGNSSPRDSRRLPIIIDARPSESMPAGLGIRRTSARRQHRREGLEIRHFKIRGNSHGPFAAGTVFGFNGKLFAMETATNNTSG